MKTYTHARLAGRRHVARLVAGTKIHLIERFDAGVAIKALCGATYGRQSAGWTDHDGPATCKRCIDRFVRVHDREGATLAGPVRIDHGMTDEHVAQLKADHKLRGLRFAVAKLQPTDPRYKAAKAELERLGLT